MFTLHSRVDNITSIESQYRRAETPGLLDFWGSFRYVRLLKVPYLHVGVNLRTAHTYTSSSFPLIWESHHAYIPVQKVPTQLISK